MKVTFVYVMIPHCFFLCNGFNSCILCVATETGGLESSIVSKKSRSVTIYTGLGWPPALVGFTCRSGRLRSRGTAQCASASSTRSSLVGSIPNHFSSHQVKRRFLCLLVNSKKRVPCSYKRSLHSSLPAGSTTWDGALVLAHALPRDPIRKVLSPPATRVLELGSGTGAVGLSAALICSSPRAVTLTDRAQLVPLIQHNISLNHLNHICNALELDWDTTPDSDLDELMHSEPFDVVLCSDVLYKLALTRSLARVLRKVMQHPNGPRAAFMAHELRPESPRCFQELKAHGIVYGRLPQSACDPQWRADDISIFFLRLQRANNPSTDASDNNINEQLRNSCAVNATSTGSDYSD